MTKYEICAYNQLTGECEIDSCQYSMPRKADALRLAKRIKKENPHWTVILQAVNEEEILDDMTIQEEQK